MQDATLEILLCTVRGDDSVVVVDQPTAISIGQEVKEIVHFAIGKAQFGSETGADHRALQIQTAAILPSYHLVERPEAAVSLPAVPGAEGLVLRVSAGVVVVREVR